MGGFLPRQVSPSLWVSPGAWSLPGPSSHLEGHPPGHLTLRTFDISRLSAVPGGRPRATPSPQTQGMRTPVLVIHIHTHTLIGITHVYTATTHTQVHSSTHSCMPAHTTPTLSHTHVHADSHTLSLTQSPAPPPPPPLSLIPSFPRRPALTSPEPARSQPLGLVCPGGYHQPMAQMLTLSRGSCGAHRSWGAGPDAGARPSLCAVPGARFTARSVRFLS